MDYSIWQKYAILWITLPYVYLNKAAIESAGNMPELVLYLFGAPRLEFKGQPLEINRRKALILAAYVASANQAVSRDVLAALLWPDATEEQARASLRTALHTLTASVPVKWLLADNFMVSIDETEIEVDTQAFARCLAETRQHRHPDDDLCSRCVTSFQQAEALYTAHFLAGFNLPDSTDYEDWHTFQGMQYQREYARILRTLAHYYAHTGEAQRALDYALRWLALDTLHEPAHRLLMQLYNETGQRHEALRQYQTCVQLLDQELATPPEEETARLYTTIRDRVTAAAPYAAPKSPAINCLPPVPVLVVGREQALRGIKARLGIQGEKRAVTMIQGLPGVGKSTIAASLAHDPELAAAYPDGILWTSLGEEPDVLSKLRAWAEVLHIEVDKTLTVETLSARISHKLQDKQVLLIVDDVWHVEHTTPFRVGGKGSAMVFTSRLNDVAMLVASSVLDLYNLSVLNSDSGLRLLAILSPNTVRDFPAAALRLVEDLEGLPLAIQVAGRLLQNEEQLGWGVEDLLLELREGSRLLHEPAPGDMLRIYEGTSPTISVLLRRSTDTLNPLTRERFALLGLFVPKPATFDLGAMQAIWDIADARTTARELVNRGLLEPVGHGRFQMHALLVSHARSLLEG